jgi:hypothetical protein
MNNAKTGGIFSIISGGIAIFFMLALILVAVFMAFMPELLDNHGFSYDSNNEAGKSVFFVIPVN